jgi:hypothetical protein
MAISRAFMVAPAASAGQPIGVPGAALWIYVRIPPDMGAGDVPVIDGLAVVAAAVVVVAAGLAVVDAAVVVVVAGLAVVDAAVVVGVDVVACVLQPIINEAHKSKKNAMTIDLFTW